MPSLKLPVLHCFQTRLRVFSIEMIQNQQMKLLFIKMRSKYAIPHIYARVTPGFGLRKVTQGRKFFLPYITLVRYNKKNTTPRLGVIFLPCITLAEVWYLYIITLVLILIHTCQQTRGPCFARLRKVKVEPFTEDH